MHAQNTMQHLQLIQFLLVLGVFFCENNFSDAGDASELGPEVIPLWPGIAPGSEGFEGQEQFNSRSPSVGNGQIKGVSKPTLTIFCPDEQSQLGTGVVICPGGGYGGLSIEKEGYTVAQWFAKHGVVAAVLKYRHGGGQHQHPVPLSDAQRALRIMRSRAEAWNLNTDRIGIAGFSAGGHLASTAGTHFDEGEPSATDPVERQGCQPNFMVLVYPVISMQAGLTHKGSKKNLLGNSPTEELTQLLSNELQVTADTCPAFITHAADDSVVPVENALRFYDSLREHKIPAELHIYEKGGHGYGMFRRDLPADQWPNLVEQWLKSQHLID